MRYQVEWGNTEKTVIIQTFEGKWIVEDQLAIAQKTHEMTVSIPHTVHLIIDARQADGFPKVVVSQVAPQIESLVPPNQGLVIAVGANEFMRALANLSRIIAPRATGNLHFVRTLDEAWEVIHQWAEPPHPAE